MDNILLDDYIKRVMAWAADAKYAAGHKTPTPIEFDLAIEVAMNNQDKHVVQVVNIRGEDRPQHNRIKFSLELR